MNGNESREQTVQLQKEFTFISVYFDFFAIFELLLTPKRPLFGNFLGFLGPNLTQRNETFFLQNGNERREQNVHFQWTKKTQRTKSLFLMNGKERTEQNVHLKWTEMNVRTKRSFKKNRCPTLLKPHFRKRQFKITKNRVLYFGLTFFSLMQILLFKLKFLKFCQNWHSLVCIYVHMVHSINYLWFYF